MPRKKKKPTKAVRRGYYDLSEVRQKIADGQWLIRSDVKVDALVDFGWQTDEILNAYKMLQPSHFWKTDSSKIDPLIVIDVYKGHVMGEDIYTHFYIDDTAHKLVINSFKRR